MRSDESRRELSQATGCSVYDRAQINVFVYLPTRNARRYRTDLCRASGAVLEWKVLLERVARVGLLESHESMLLLQKGVLAQYQIGYSR